MISARVGAPRAARHAEVTLGLGSGLESGLSAWSLAALGCGSGLLAMMAARAGASRVCALEMVSSLAAVARHIVRANGWQDTIEVVSEMSTKVGPSRIGGAADILVCEIVDDQL